MSKTCKGLAKTWNLWKNSLSHTVVCVKATTLGMPRSSEKTMTKKYSHTLAWREKNTCFLFIFQYSVLLMYLTNARLLVIKKTSIFALFGSCAHVSKYMSMYCLKWSFTSFPPEHVLKYLRSQIHHSKMSLSRPPWSLEFKFQIHLHLIANDWNPINVRFLSFLKCLLGLYFTNVSHGHLPPFTWDFHFTAIDGWPLKALFISPD